MKNINYLHVILTVIAILLAVVAWEQKYAVSSDGQLLFNRLTGNTSTWQEHHPIIKKMAAIEKEHGRNDEWWRLRRQMSQLPIP